MNFMTTSPLTPFEVCQLAGQILDINSGACCTESITMKGQCKKLTDEEICEQANQIVDERSNGIKCCVEGNILGECELRKSELTDEEICEQAGQIVNEGINGNKCCVEGNLLGECELLESDLTKGKICELANQIPVLNNLENFCCVGDPATGECLELTPEELYKACFDDLEDDQQCKLVEQLLDITPNLGQLC